VGRVETAKAVSVDEPDGQRAVVALGALDLRFQPRVQVLGAE